MTARVIDGANIAARVREEVKRAVTEMLVRRDAHKTLLRMDLQLTSGYAVRNAVLMSGQRLRAVQGASALLLQQRADEEGLSVYILISEYLTSAADVDLQLENHRSWIKLGYQSGRILFSGRLVPATGGAIVLRAASRSEVVDLIETDPYVRHNLVRYAIYEVSDTAFPHRSQAFDEFMNVPYDDALSVSDA